MKKVVVTGACGFIGKALTIKLLQEGQKVYAVDVNKDLIDELKLYGDVISIEASFEDYYNLHSSIRDEDIDVFYHFAFHGSFGSESLKDYKIQLTNTIATCNAVMLAIKLKAKKFVFASSINELEVKNYINKDKIEPRFTCIYSAAKIACEIIGKTLAYNYGIEFVSGLISMPFGYGNKAMTLPNILISKLNKNEVPKLVTGNNKYDLIYIDDVVNAFISIGEKGINQKSYYVGHRKLKTFREIVTDIRNIINPNIELVFGEYKDNLDMDYSLIDLDALYNDTGFECKADFKESILKTAEWVKMLDI